VIIPFPTAVLMVYHALTSEGIHDGPLAPLAKRTRE